jgi:acetyl esterase/lipase
MSSVVLRSIASTENHDVSPLGSDPMVHADADMRHVLEVWAGMDPKPIERCTVLEARAQPTLAVALARLLNGRAEDDGISMELRMIPGAAGELKARVYAPAGAAAARPMVLYIHGGGFVLGDLGADDTTPRALARRLGAVVVATHYRQAPEAKLPAAYDDVRAAWRWLVEAAPSLGGDPARAAIVGEDAGANLAVDLALALRGTGAPLRHLGLVTPMAAPDFDLPSQRENARSRPLSAAGLRWLYRMATSSSAELRDGRLNLVDRELGGLPPVTLILAGLDPLRSEGELLADALRRSGIWVDATTYEGVTHGFLGLARVVNKAMFARSQLLRNIGESMA